MKKILFLVSFLLTFIFTPQFVQAHVLKSSGSIGAVLHIDPEDDPIVGEPSGFYFEFKDTKDQFKPENCSCTFSVIQNGKEIYSQPLFSDNSQPSLTSASVFFTFPQRDVYTIKVVGEPHTPGTFEPFTLSYDIRVERTANAQTLRSSNKDILSSQNQFVKFAPFVFFGILVLGFVLYYVLKRKQRN